MLFILFRNGEIFMVYWWEDGAIIVGGRVSDHHHGPFFQLDFFQGLDLFTFFRIFTNQNQIIIHHFFFFFLSLFNSLPPNYEGGGGVRKCDIPKHKTLSNTIFVTFYQRHFQLKLFYLTKIHRSLLILFCF